MSLARSSGAAPVSLAHSAATISALTLVSRLSGFGRTLVAAGVLGTTFLGNTYQAANSVPNMVFELVAAGALQAVLVPGLVQALDRHGRAGADELAGLVLGTLAALLGAAMAVGVLAAPALAAALFSGAEPAVREDQVRLGTVFLLIFLPQVLCYAWGAVSSAVLHAQGRFVAPAVAPVVNNVVVIAAYCGFWAMRGGAPPSLDLSFAEVAVLAGGTTAGVVAFSAVPVVAARRLGFRLRPRLGLRHPDIRDLASQGAWAAAFLALGQGLLVAVLVLANGVEGGVVAYQLALAFFLLPHALIAVPLVTAAYPGLARAGRAGDEGGFVALARQSSEAAVLLGLAATAALFALGTPLAQVALFGEAAGGVGITGPAISAFALGLVPYGLFLLLTRAHYAQGDARRPAEVQAVVTVAGVVAMVAASAILHPSDRVAGLAAAHSGAHLLGAALLAASARRRLGAGVSVVPLAPAAKALGAAALAALAMLAVVRGVDAGSRTGALAVVAAGGAFGMAVYGLGLWAWGVADLRALAARLGRRS